MNENSLKNLMSPEELNARLTPEERKKNASKAGKASGQAKSFRGIVKKHLKESPETMEELYNVVLEKALSGDLKALEMLIELNGESPKQQEIKLKERDMKLKEKAFEKDNW